MFLAVFAGLSSNVYNILSRIILRQDSDPISYAWLYEISRIVIFLFVLPFTFYFNLSLINILLLLLLGLVEFISVYVFMKMHAYVEISISSVIAKLRLVWTPILAFFFLREALSNFEYLGIVVIFLGLTITVSPKKLILDKGMKYALLSSMVVPVISVLLKKTSDFSSTPVQMIFMGMPSVLLFGTVSSNWKERVTKVFKKSYKKIFIATIFNCSAMYFLVWAFKEGSVGKVATIYQSMTLVSVMVGINFLKEKEDIWKKVIGSVVTIAGVLLLI